MPLLQCDQRHYGYPFEDKVGMICLESVRCNRCHPITQICPSPHCLFLYCSLLLSKIVSVQFASLTLALGFGALDAGFYCVAVLGMLVVFAKLTETRGFLSLGRLDCPLCQDRKDEFCRHFLSNSLVHATLCSCRFWPIVYILINQQSTKWCRYL